MSRQRVDERPGFFPRVEAKKKDMPYTEYDTDCLLNYLFREGSFSDHVIKMWQDANGRSNKAVDRQFELFRYVEPGNKIWTYVPTSTREWRGGLPYNAVDMELIYIHLKTPTAILVERTALILQRTPAELQLKLEQMTAKGVKRTEQGYRL